MDVTRKHVRLPKPFHLLFARHGILHVITRRNLALRHDPRVMEAVPANDCSLSSQQTILGELDRHVSEMNQPVSHLHRKRQHPGHRIALFIHAQTLRQVQHPATLRIDRPARSRERPYRFKHRPIAA